MKGIVKWFNNDKGYGFIENSKIKNIFVYYDAIREKGYKTLVQNEEVLFDLVKTEKDFKAKNVISLSKISRTT